MLQSGGAASGVGVFPGALALLVLLLELVVWLLALFNGSICASEMLGQRKSISASKASAPWPDSQSLLWMGTEAAAVAAGKAGRGSELGRDFSMFAEIFSTESSVLPQ